MKEIILSMIEIIDTHNSAYEKNIELDGSGELVDVISKGIRSSIRKDLIKFITDKNYTPEYIYNMCIAYKLEIDSDPISSFMGWMIDIEHDMYDVAEMVMAVIENNFVSTSQKNFIIRFLKRHDILEFERGSNTKIKSPIKINAENASPNHEDSLRKISRHIQKKRFSRHYIQDFYERLRKREPTSGKEVNCMVYLESCDIECGEANGDELARHNILSSILTKHIITLTDTDGVKTEIIVNNYIGEVVMDNVICELENVRSLITGLYSYE